MNKNLTFYVSFPGIKSCVYRLNDYSLKKMLFILYDYN